MSPLLVPHGQKLFTLPDATLLRCDAPDLGDGLYEALPHDPDVRFVTVQDGRLTAAVDSVLLGICNGQQRPASYRVNGAVFLRRAAVYRNWRARAAAGESPEGRCVLGYEMPADRSVDVDDAVDFALALVFAALVLPFIILASIAIKLDSRGPIFFRQRRVGKNGRIFRMLKLRTMVREAESRSGPVWATEGDPRVTRVGRFLRATHLDELPQLLNVLKGDMSLVGPRPERPVFVRIFNEAIANYGKRHTVRPGITGLAQVHRKYDETIGDVRRKLAFDLFYIRRMCWAVDVRILWSTMGRVFRKAGR